MKKYEQWIKNYYVRAFLIGLMISFCMIIPFIIRGHGIFTLIDDFNYQQIPFNMMNNEAVKNGDVYWNWYTDLGSNFIGSYSFYTLGSPFFWISMIFPADIFPYLIGPLLILKYSIACLTAYMYIQRFIKYKPYALIGAALYTFSGFQMVNLMFNHFHDVVALFPLLLIGLEELIEKKRFILYSLAVALLSTLSFFFFEGQVIYLVIYFCVRFLSYDLKKYIKEVPKCLAGGLLGMAISGWILIPSILYTLQNPRVGNGFFYGADALVYDKDRYLILLKAFFMPAEVPQEISAIIKYNFMSCEIYLPLAGGVLAVLLVFSTKTWITRLLKVSAIFLLIPILNSVFSGFNVVPYFRWLYMPILILSLASAKALEDTACKDRKKIISVFALYTGILVCLVIYLRYWPWGYEQKGCITDGANFKRYLIITVLGLIITFIAVNINKNKRKAQLLLTGISLCSIILGVWHIYRTQAYYGDESTEKYVENFLNLKDEIKLENSENYRINIDNNIGGDIPEYLTSNLSLILEKPSVESYHSNISPSIYKFYESLGITREGNVATIIPNDQFGIFDFLSVKYTITRDEKTKEIVVEENENFLPIGLNYKYYIPRSEFMQIDQNIRHQILLKAVVVNDEDIPQIETLLRKIPDSELNKISKNDYVSDVKQLQENTVKNFDRYNSGFKAEFNAAQETYIYFSVPYDKGWTARVNGEKIKILEENGFMLIPVTQGDNFIEFEYEVPGFKVGIICSIVSILGCIAYTAINYRYKSIRGKLN